MFIEEQASVRPSVPLLYAAADTQNTGTKVPAAAAFLPAQRLLVPWKTSHCGLLVLS